MILFITFWTLVIFLSIAWYLALVFYIGWRGAREVKQMTQRLNDRDKEND